MKIKLLLLLFLTTTHGIFAQKLYRNIFERIYEIQKEEGDSIAANRLYEIHQSLNKSKKLKFANKADSLFILEMIDIETGICYGKIWNNQKELNYKYYTYPKRKFDFSIKNAFTKYVQDLVYNWDIETIKNDEKTNGIISANNIYSFRIILGDTITIDNFRFLEFHDPK